MKRDLWGVMLLLLSAFARPGHLLGADISGDTSQWRFSDIFAYSGAYADTLSPAEKKKYAQFMISCQDPETGLFVDKFGTSEYSLKVYWTLGTLGYKPKYPLAVCNSPATKDECSEKMGAAAFRKWMDKMHETQDFYAAGSRIGHFIEPHCINLRNAGKPIESSEYVQEFKKWFIEKQKPNGLWNKEGDPDCNCWNGLMKMDGTLGITNTTLPHPERLIKTIIANLNVKEGYFGGGGCTQMNAMNMMDRHSSRNGLLLWEEVFRCMETYANCLERRYDAATGDFRPPPGFNQPSESGMTGIAVGEAANIAGFCSKLLDPKNAAVVAVGNQHPPAGEKPITQDRIVRLYVQTNGLMNIAETKNKARIKAEHEAKYGKAQGK
jgi:hypothetical protein